MKYFAQIGKYNDEYKKKSFCCHLSLYIYYITKCCEDRFPLIFLN